LRVAGQAGQGERGAVRDGRRGCRDLERAGGRLALIDRLAALLARTPAELLPTVCYLCQGLIAPQFASADLGLAEKLAVRAVATATGAGPGQVAAGVRETGVLGQAAGQMLTVTAVGRPAWRSRSWWARCIGSPGPRGRVRRAASWTCWPAAVSPCRTDDRCAFIRLGDTVARFTVMRIAGIG
jgi:hypothetical protein